MNENSSIPDENAYGWGLDTSADAAFIQAIDEIAKNNSKVRKYIHLGITPMPLQLVGMEEMKVTIHTDVIRKAIGQQIGIPHPRADKPPHNIEVEVFKKLMAEINNPVAIFSTKNKYSGEQAYLILTNLIELKPANELSHHNLAENREKGISAILYLTQDSHSLELSKIVSVYGRNPSQIINAINKRETLYWNIEKGQQLSQKFGVQFPSVVTNSADLSNSKIKTESDLRQALEQKISKLNKELLPTKLPIADRDVGKLAYDAIGGDMNRLPQIKEALRERGYQLDERYFKGITHSVQIEQAFTKAVKKQRVVNHNPAKAASEYQR